VRSWSGNKAYTSSKQQQQQQQVHRLKLTIGA